jgi:CheY-like chemotaxis protein
VVTASAGKDTAEQALAAGAWQVLPKPVDFHRLLVRGRTKALRNWAPTSKRCRRILPTISVSRRKVGTWLRS